jgi:predicted XRE-type DNA-binding protein
VLDDDSMLGAGYAPGCIAKIGRDPPKRHKQPVPPHGWGLMKRRLYAERSGNVFADLNLSKADDLLVKADLTAKIIAETERRNLTQNQAAALLGIDQPKISALSSKANSPDSPSSACFAPSCCSGAISKSR